jgi:NADPH:quinone reductase-like Zn-dependent oxidoreductase
MAARTTATAIPATMKAAAIDRYGPASVLTVRELDTPEPEPHEILIQVHTAGIGIWDTEMRSGSWKPPGRPKFPRVLGLDGSGVVVAKGARVTRLRVGDRVWAYDFDRAGFYAQYVAVSATLAARIPERMSLRNAGAAAVTGLTALQCVARADVRRGQTVLVFGATGAVGTLALQFAAARGARVIATATGRKATELVRKLGAKVAIDARRSDAVDALDRAAPDGIDAVLAFAGGRGLEKLIDRLRRGGHLVYPNGVDPKPDAPPGVRAKSFDAEAGPDEFAQLSRAVTSAKLKVPIDRQYPLARAADAHRRIEKEHVLGRLVLAVQRADD